MALIKYARAQVVHPGHSINSWDRVRGSNTKVAAVNLISRAAGIFDKQFDPNDYLLTHCTIVCSVDNYTPSGSLSKTGKVSFEGKSVNRKYPDYRITPDSDKFINNNLDAWSRGVILKSYPSFIGAHNFVEHVQIEEQSKGRIIDAVVREVAGSLYVDILVATDKKHEELIRQIESGKMSALSMGCTIDFGICTYCGNVAVDETQQCEHVKYQKGNKFFDQNGQQVRIAELCGHESVGDDGGVQFIEASWVATPAFTGAVLRNILTAEDVTGDMVRKAEDVLRSVPREWSAEGVKKLSSLGQSRYAFMDEEDEGGSPDDDRDPLDQLSDDVKEFVIDRVRKEVQDQIRREEQAEQLSPQESSVAPNDSIIKQASLRKIGYNLGIRAILAASNSDKEVIGKLAALNASYGISVKPHLYKAAIRLGSSSQYRSLSNFVKASEKVLGRPPTVPEMRTLIRIGKILANRECTKEMGNGKSNS